MRKPWLFLLLAIPIVSEAQKRCSKGIPCGNSCIAAGKTCRIGSPAPNPAPRPPITAAPAAPPTVQSLIGDTSSPRQPVSVIAPTSARREYQFLQLETDDVATVVNGQARDGWRVHTVVAGRLTTGKKRDGFYVLLERDVIRSTP